jgi:organic hydroperoxide reductase OsmC/OhrA
MTGKTEKQFFFETRLHWEAGKDAVLSAKNVPGNILVDAPAEFGGKGTEWTPEYLFLNAIGSCFLTTYQAFAKKMHFEISRIECNTIGQIERIEGSYKFTHINLFPKIFVRNHEAREKANLAVEKTHKYCLISNSVNALVFYHTEVLLEEPVVS